jgi:hypothetical protein
MERKNWRNDELFSTSMLLGVSAHVMYLLSTGRNAWNNVWIQRYKGPTSLHFTLEAAKKKAEPVRVQGTVFSIEQVPVLAFRSRTGIAYCAEFHSKESFKMLNWDDEMNYLKIGTAMPDVMAVFSKSDPNTWTYPWPVPDSYVTRVFDLVGKYDPKTGKTMARDVELLDRDAKLFRWKSRPMGPGHLGWNRSESDRKLESVERIIRKFEAINSPELKEAADELFLAADKFVKCHFEKNWIAPAPELPILLSNGKLYRFPEPTIDDQE